MRAYPVLLILLVAVSSCQGLVAHGLLPIGLAVGKTLVGAALRGHRQVTTHLGVGRGQIIRAVGSRVAGAVQGGAGAVRETLEDLRDDAYGRDRDDRELSELKEQSADFLNDIDDLKEEVKNLRSFIIYLSNELRSSNGLITTSGVVELTASRPTVTVPFDVSFKRRVPQLQWGLIGFYGTNVGIDNSSDDTYTYGPQSNGPPHMFVLVDAHSTTTSATFSLSDNSSPDWKFNKVLIQWTAISGDNDDDDDNDDRDEYPY